MSGPKRFKGMSANTGKLLRSGEGQEVDFKRTPDAVVTDDFVAFANSDVGGTILAGVDESVGPGGAQVGHVIGCEVSDGSILQVTNKALSCIPPVGIEVSIENLGKVPFLRIDIRSSSTKPHCTPKGVYCRRDGNRNRPLHPSELLRIFLESESRAFAERFESAASRITNDIASLETSLDDSIRDMGRKLGWAESQLDDTESTLSSIESDVQRLTAEARDLTTRLRALFRDEKRHDPIYDRERNKLLSEMVDLLKKDRKALRAFRSGKQASVSVRGRAAEELSQEDITAVVREAITVVSQIEQAKYAITVKMPAEFNEGELAASAKLITKGGEVAAGIERRLPTAASLGLIRYEKKIVGTAALKRPTAEYRKRVFEKAKASVAPVDAPLELGWIFLEKEHRSMGQMRSLIQLLIGAAAKEAVFATTRASNEKMQRILADQKFARHGETYPSDENAGEDIVLFIRPANTSGDETVLGK